jgi:hypothetical protein|tara:strand:- start:402 stop:623 length:222 start_codon:yes stop_codon:yes gene_type:complete
MNEFVLVIIVTMGLGKEPYSFEIRLPKETYKKCIEDSKTYEFPHKEIHKVISVKTRCEKVVGNPKQLNKGKSI